MSNLVHLKNDIWSLSLWPEKGGCIVSAACHGFPVLRDADLARIEAGDIFASSCFPMVPFSNRIAGGVFPFKGRDIRLKKNHAENIYPIHGNGWQAAWEVEKLTEHHCEIVMTYTPKSGGWPWAFTARQKITLEGASLTIELSIKNTGNDTFPVGLGLHPSFSDPKTALVKFSTGKMWACNEQLIPTKLVPLESQNDFSAYTSIGDKSLDNCFEDWNGRAEFKWPDLKGTVCMEGGPQFSHLVVFHDPKNDYFCVEPTTHANNALNMQTAKETTLLSPNTRFGDFMILTYSSEN